jgi:L-arabinonolactonase
MEKPTGCLYALDRDRTVRRLLEGLYAPNGICWSPDGAQMYLTDSVLKTVFRFDYDAERGQIANRTVFVETSEFTGAPDGAAIDADGHYWVAMCGGGELLRFDTAGKLERRVAMPGAFVTGLAFGGARLDEIYVTSLHPSILRQDGSGGETYVVREAGVRGLPQRRFDG